ncbi:MAG: dockerin type I domain-containing protein [Pirellulales bacterium]
MVCNGYQRAVWIRAATVAVALVLSISDGAFGDWSDDFSGNQAHNPAGGTWGYVGLTLAAVPQDIPNWTPQFSGDRLVVPRPGTPGGQAMFLAAGYVGSTSGTTHHYQNVRVGGTVGVGDNGGPGNNNLIGLLARANDYDSYVLVVDHNDGTINLIKSLNSNPAAPTTIESAAIFGYAPLLEFYLQLDVLDTAGGTTLVGRVYENASRVNLLNTITAFDDAGGGVPGAPHPAFYSGFVAQYNTAATTPTTIDAYFDNMSSTTLRPGDVNLDGTVNRADAAILARNFGMSAGATWDDGDLDGNGRVDLADMAQVQRRLTTGPVIIGPPVDVAANAAAVPEPSSAILATLGVAAGCGLVRRRRHRC